jgi:hypothetical protein
VSSASGKMEGPDRFPLNAGVTVRNLIFLCVLATASTAWGRGRTKPPRKPPVAKPAPAAVVEEAARPDPPPEPKPEPPKAPAKEKKAKVYTFTGLDVEGKLKTPQLLFFLNRVKLELDTTSPERRSFLKELEKSSDDKGL